MNGHLIPGTPIAVDTWRQKDVQEARIFFLTHAHADHVIGLTSKWDKVIYTSEITGKIIIHKLKIQPHIVKGLEIGVSHLIPMDETGDEYLTVTLIDANHCPGAVMFVFEGYFGTIFYTGDFRFKLKILDDVKIICPRGIDDLYLDNTYAEKSYVFDKREIAFRHIIDLIEQHLEDHDIVLGIRYLGREDLLLHIAQRFNTVISVFQKKYELLKLLNVHGNFKTCGKSKIRVVLFTEVNNVSIARWNKKKPTIAILPTCLFVGKNRNFDKRIFLVPYSDHSSCEELIEFVTAIRPKRIYPIVGRGRLNIFDHLLKGDEECRSFAIPPSVLKFMQEKIVTKKVARNCSFKIQAVKGVVYEIPETFEAFEEIERNGRNSNESSTMNREKILHTENENNFCSQIASMIINENEKNETPLGLALPETQDRAASENIEVENATGESYVSKSINDENSSVEAFKLDSLFSSVSFQSDASCIGYINISEIFSNPSNRIELREFTIEREKKLDMQFSKDLKEEDKFSRCVNWLNKHKLEFEGQESCKRTKIEA